MTAILRQMDDFHYNHYINTFKTRQDIIVSLGNELSTIIITITILISLLSFGLIKPSALAPAATISGNLFVGCQWGGGICGIEEKIFF